MTKDKVEVGGRYIAKVSGRLVVVKILGERSLTRGWTALNCATGRHICIRSAQRLRRAISEVDEQRWLRAGL
jgi:hypothetical protein